MVVTVEGFHMSKERDETGLVRAACWQLCDAKDSYSCAMLCESWGDVVEWQGEGERGTRAMARKASEWLMRTLPMSLTGTVTFRVRWLVAVQRANAVLPRTRSDLQTARPLRSHSYPYQSAAHYVRSRSHDHGEESFHLEGSPSILSSSSRAMPSNKRKGHL